jgi:hypothetical protein
VIGLCLAAAQGVTAWRDPSPHHVQFVTVDSSVRLEVLVREIRAFAAGLLPLHFQTRPVKSPEAALPFSCATFSAHISEAELRGRFGSDNVTTGLVSWGGAEGDYNDGTILFANLPDARLEIYWKNREARRDPAWIQIRGTRSRWRSPAGLTLGTDLKTVERLNRRPFRIAGFGTDLSGGLHSWSDGVLARQNVGGCRMGFRFVTGDIQGRPELRALSRQVGDGGTYSSGHPEMQGLNPRIGEAVITYWP